VVSCTDFFSSSINVKMFVLICLGGRRVCMSKCPHAWICVSLPNMPICLYSNLCCYRLTVNLYWVSSYNIFEIHLSCKYRDVHRTEQYLCTSLFFAVDGLGLICYLKFYRMLFIYVNLMLSLCNFCFPP